MFFIWVIWSEIKKTKPQQCKESTYSWLSHWRKEFILLSRLTVLKAVPLNSCFLYYITESLLHNNINIREWIVFILQSWWCDGSWIESKYLQIIFFILFVIEEEVIQRQLTLLSNFASSEARNCSTSNETAASL